MNKIGPYVAAIAIALSWVELGICQDYPTRPIRVYVGAASGGSLEVSARIVAQKLTEYLGQSVIVEARPGASGILANDRVAKSPPDGYTLLTMAATGVIQAALRTDLPYDLEKDLVPISLLTITPIVMVVHPSLPARSLKEVVGLAKKYPGQLKFGTSGVGTTSHLAGEALNAMAGVKLTHIPYKGGAESVLAAASGQVEIGFPGITSVPSLAAVGKVVPIAITTLDRAPLLPKVPTFQESGYPGYDFSVWAGLLGPAGMPKPIVTRLNALVVRVNTAKEMKESFEKQGLIVRSASPEEFAEFMRKELEVNKKLIKFAGIKAD